MAPRRETSGLHGGRMVLAWVGTARSEEARRAALAVIAAAPDRQGSGASGHSALNGDFRGGHVLVLRHVAFVVFIWRADRAPPALGEVGELAEASDAAESVKRRQAAGDLLMIFAGVVAMAGGTTRLVDALQRISGIKSVQTRLGLTIVGFELVVLAWSAAPRRTTDAMVAGVFGSAAYNVTMTLGVGALTHPLSIAQARLLDLPLLVVLGALTLVAFIVARRSMLGRVDSIVLLDYPLFIVLCFAR